MKFVINSILLLGLFGATLADDECPCTLVDSPAYPGTFRWNCYNLALTSVPGQCYDIQSDNVTELVLTNNLITDIRTIDFAGLSDMKALYVDTNAIEYFDPTALDGIDGLEIFNAAHNSDMEIPSLTLREKYELLEVNLVGSKVLNLPTITDSTKLTKLDARSCDLSTLSRPLFGTLTSTDFLLNLVGNSIVDVAADIFLPIPSNGVINVDSYVTLWAKDTDEKNEVIDKEWVINIDLDVNLKVCDVDGTPTDLTMC